MVELRWAIPSSTTADRPRLQYRQCGDIIQFGSESGWTEWRDVPYVVVPQEPPKPAPTALTAAGVMGTPAPSKEHRDLMLLAASDLESWMKSYHRDAATEDLVKRLRDAAGVSLVDGESESQQTPIPSPMDYEGEG